MYTSVTDNIVYFVHPSKHIHIFICSCRYTQTQLCLYGWRLYGPFALCVCKTHGVCNVHRVCNVHGVCVMYTGCVTYMGGV